MPVPAHLDPVQATCRGIPRLGYAASGLQPGMRDCPEEVPVALSYNGSTHAVMMATPDDLEDFALGFSLTEDIVASPSEIETIEVAAFEESGIEVRVWLAEAPSSRLQARRRRLAGPVGCGTCGLESLQEALRGSPRIAPGHLRIAGHHVAEALKALEAHQALNRITHAVHAAALWRPDKGILAIREDVGRHNALDKLAGAAARQGLQTANALALVTSRVSVDLIQKAARLGSPILAAVSVPTALAVRAAEECGITLIAIARGERFEVFTHPGRILATATAA